MILEPKLEKLSRVYFFNDVPIILATLMNRLHHVSANKGPTLHITHTPMEFYVIAKTFEDTVHFTPGILLQSSQSSSRAAQITSTSPIYTTPYPAPTTFNVLN